MKDLDIKSLLIGTLLTATIFLGIAATSPTDKWDANQQWATKGVRYQSPEEAKLKQDAWQPFAFAFDKGSYVWYRKRVK